MSEPNHQGRIVRASVRIHASPETVWDAWTNPAHLSQWFPDRAEGSAAVGETVRWKFDRFETEMTYDVLAVDERKRLVLGPSRGGSTSVLEVQLEEAPGETIVRLVNSGLRDDPDGEDVAGVESGWQMALGILKYYVEKHFGQDRKCFFAVREAQFEYENLVQYYRDGYKLALWLTNEGAVVNGKPSVRLLLRDGRTLSGMVLTETEREIALSWDEIDGFIELKAFSVGDGKRAVCVRGCGWGLSTEEARVIESSMEGALDRLVAALAA